MSTAQPGTSASDGDDVAGGSAPPEPPSTDEGTGFKVNLANFSGPFDLLLQLIGKHKLDVTEVALHTVTDEFIAYIRAMGNDWDLDEVSEFLVIASTLLDLKAARLLPSAAVEDEEDLALLEARDILFARLLQYKAYKEAAAYLARLEHTGARRWPRAVALEAAFAQALPELVLGIGPQRLRDLAIKAMTPKVVPTVGLSHVHMERVSVREHAALLRDVLLRQQVGTFRALCSDCKSTLEIVARFLALLELYREGLISFDQVQALGELTVRWTGPTDAPIDLDIDEYAGSAAEAGVAAADVPAPGADAVDEPHSIDAESDAGADPGIDGPGMEAVEPSYMTALSPRSSNGSFGVDVDIADSDVTDSDVMEWDAMESGVTDTDATDTDATDTDVMDSDVVDSDVMDSDVVESDAKESDITESDVTKSDVTESDGAEFVDLDVDGADFDDSDFDGRDADDDQDEVRARADYGTHPADADLQGEPQ